MAHEHLLKEHTYLHVASGDTPILEYRRLRSYISKLVTSRFFQKWCSSGVVSALLLQRTTDFTGFFRTFRDIAVAHKKYFYHLFITPHKSCISFQILTITGFFTLFVQPEHPPVLKISSRIFSGFLMFFPAILVKALVKKAALPTGNFKRLPHAAVHLWHHQTSHGCRYSALR